MAAYIAGMGSNVPLCVQRARALHVPCADDLWVSCGQNEGVFCRVAARAAQAGLPAARALLHASTSERVGCPHCGGARCVTVTMMQTRSADEGETARHCCALCRKRWSA